MAKRIVTIDRELCKREKCGYLCARVCPKNRAEEKCITVEEQTKFPVVDENLCIGCGLCALKCRKASYNAIQIVNLPQELDENPIHRYGRNRFALFRLPVPKNRMVVGIVGQNGIGKSTAIKILSGELQPNLGEFRKKAGWEEIIEKYKGTELQDYLTKLREKQVKVSYKPQQVDSIPKLWKGKVSGHVKGAVVNEDLLKNLNIKGILDKDIATLSGGELHLLAIYATMAKEAELYFFDEPSSYLDVEQRLLVAGEIRKLSEKAMVIVIEHDLAVADYLADQVHIIYGRPGSFGVISKPYGVRIGINTYLDGYMREENVRFRDESIVFSKSASVSMKRSPFLEFSAFKKRFGGFSMETEAGTLYRGEVVGILGPNATGKTTFINMLSGKEKPDEGKPAEGLRLSYKPQRIALSPDESLMDAREYLEKEMEDISSVRSQKILRALELERLLERTMGNLSGGELQAIMIAAALGRGFDVLLMDEPTAFLDVEQRLRVGKLIREIVEEKEAACFVVDHDLQIVDSIADRLMVFEGVRGVKGHGRSPASLHDGMNRFLKSLGITFRRDPQTGRARANKPESVKDREQKEIGEYYYLQ